VRSGRGQDSNLQIANPALYHTATSASILVVSLRIVYWSSLR